MAVTVSYFMIFSPSCPTQKRARFKVLTHPVPGGPWESGGIDCSKDQNYCSPEKSSQKNPKKSFPSEELMAMLTPFFRVGGDARVRKKPKIKQHFAFHTVNSVTAIYGAPPAFSTNLKRPNATAPELCTLLK